MDSVLSGTMTKNETTPLRRSRNGHDEPVQFLCGDSLTVLKTLPDRFVQTIVTSPPYYRVRDYEIDRQIGQERTTQEYVTKLIAVFHEAKRVLKDDGVLWLVLGDSYVGSSRKNEANLCGLKPGNLHLIPWQIASAVQEDGWVLRQWCPWLKRNAMPESVRSRPTAACEIVLMFTKSTKYFYDSRAVEKAAATTPTPNGKYRFGTPGGKVARIPGRRHLDSGQAWRPHTKPLPDEQPQNSIRVSSVNVGPDQTYVTRLRRNSDWFFESWQGLLGDEDGHPLAFIVNPARLKALHFATFPMRLVEPCILSSSRPGDTILDLFGGSGTVGVAAVRHGRKAVLIDLNPEYLEIAKQRVREESLSGETGRFQFGGTGRLA